jgi:hypothetical protein
MKKILFSVIFILLFWSAKSQVNVTATAGTLSGSYTTVKGAFDAINAGTHNGAIPISLGTAANQTITETSQALLNKNGSGSANYTSITINPAFSNITVSASFAGACCEPTGIIQLNAAENVTIEGRIGSSGTINDLTFENTSTGSYSTSLFFNGASNNIVRYCNIKSSTTSTIGGCGTVSFINNAAGCSNNTIEYCVITKSGLNKPQMAIASKGWNTGKNQNNIIRYCTISDFQRAGIWLGNSGAIGYNESWTIDHNIFYQSSAFAIDGSKYDNFAIYIGYHTTGAIGSSNNESGSFTITNNTIGGNGSGGNWTVTGSSFNNIICGIYVAANSTSYTEISGNVIKDFDVETQFFYGICTDQTKVKIGSSGGNTISNIILKHPASGGGSAGGIYVNTNADYVTEIKNNSITNLSAGSGNKYSNFYGVYNCSSATHPKDIVQKNTVTNIDASNADAFKGFYVQGYIAQSHVSKIKYSGTNPMYGIYWNGGRATGLDYRVENNEVILGLDNSGLSTAVNSDVYGIYSSRSEINLFYNSILLKGTATTKNSYCLRLGTNATGYVVKNNLLYNERSGGSGNHYCISTAFSTTSNWTSSNNAYVLNSGSKASYYLGDWNSIPKITLSDWTSASTETNSISETSANKPTVALFSNLATLNNLSVNDSWLCSGTVVAATTDFFGNPRSLLGTTTIGAYESGCSVTTVGADINTTNFLSLYPNPAKNDLFISTSIADYSLTIYNSTGSMMHQSQNATLVDISSFPCGLYFLQILNNETGRKTIKPFIKE